MKRTFCALLACLFLFGLLSCGTAVEPDPSESAEPSKTESDSASAILSEDPVSAYSLPPFGESEESGNLEQPSEETEEPSETAPESSEENHSSEPEQSIETSREESKEQSQGETSRPKETSETSSSGEIDWTPHMSNGFLVVGNRGMEKFGGTHVGGELTAELLNKFQASVGSGVQVYAMPVPTAVAFYAPEGYEKSSLCIQDCFYGMRDALEGVKFADLYGAILPHKDEEVYARTDHHWFARGAYYAAEELCRVAGTDFATLDQFTEYSREGFIGSVVSAYGVTELKKYPEIMYWYEPTQEYECDYYTMDDKFKFSGSMFSSSGSYTKFIHGDAYCVKIKAGVNNGRKLLVIKDSFGNALAPFLIAGFEEVHMFDIRNFEKNALKYIETYGITDVAFALSAFTVAGTKRNNITRLMTLKK